MDIRQLRVIQMVCETGSVTETAKRLHVSQPAISKTIKLVETATGLELFENIQGRLVPTTQVQTLLPEIRRLLNTHRDVTRQIANLRAGKSGVVRLAVAPSLLPTLGAEAVKRFQAQRPDVDIKIITTSTRDIVSLVARHEVDVGICQPSSGDASVRVWPVATGRVICVFPEHHPLAEKEEVTPFDLEGENIITFPDTEPTAMRIADTFLACGRKFNRTIETNQSFGACCIATQGAGIALVDSFIHTQDYFPRLAVRPFAPAIQLDVHLHLSGLRTPPGVVQDLCDEIAAVGEKITN